MTRLYKHYKGSLYGIIAEGRSTGTERDVVIYQSVETGEIWVRDKVEFFDVLTTLEDTEISRFTEIMIDEEKLSFLGNLN